MSTETPNITQQQSRATTIPVSLCIVTNRIDMRVEEIVKVCEAWFAEILIGYDGDMLTVPSGLAQAGPVKIVPVQWEGYSTTKNKLADLASNAWILSLDGDEVPDTLLLASMAALPYASLATNHIYTFKRHSFFEGRKIQHGAWGRDKVIRLYHKEYTRWNDDVVHEALILKPGTELIRLPGILLHYTADDYASFWEKNKKYARLSADKYFQRGKPSPWWKRAFSPAFTFVREYVFEAGFMDGKAGFKIARINALYTYWKYAFLKEYYQERAN